MSSTPTFALERATLDNGLRILVSEDRAAPVVAVAVLYDVGFRSEPEGRTGFAHLFEHMMFQGSANVGKMEHAHLVMGNGGTLNGTTTRDYTSYYEAIPAGALELAFYLEADRMGSVAVTEENLHNQISVVQEEIRVNVLNRPYGGFPWIHLPRVMFDTFPNNHDGYGSFADLEAASVDDAWDFYQTYYAPSNALLVVVGDTSADTVVELAERHFGPITGRAAPDIPSFHEPLPRRERVSVRHDEQAPTPAVALGYRAPDPIEQLPDLAALSVLADVLTTGRGARLVRRLIREMGIVTSIDAWIGESPGWGGPLDVRGPTWFQFVAHYPKRALRLQLVEAIDGELGRVVADGPSAHELDRARARLTSGTWRGLDSFLGRCMAMAPPELHRGRAELAWQLTDHVREVDEGDVIRVTAEWLRPELRTMLEIVPGRGE